MSSVNTVCETIVSVRNGRKHTFMVAVSLLVVISKDRGESGQQDTAPDSLETDENEDAALP